MQILEFLNNMCISELNFVQTYIAALDKYPLKNKGRRHHGFLYTISGTETYHFHDSKIETPPGSMLYIPKGGELRNNAVRRRERRYCVGF